MKRPGIAHKREDPETGGQIWVMGYVPLSDATVEQSIRLYFASGRKRPKRGMIVKIDCLKR